ncbi:iron complex outermembrane recepter protein [Hymenobacter gelipurpurascens]|uniref:Iron complex outermembrane recepter protein n=1 Tax=Hymenobacter gelipurpurascens TaxID=89968 RepID=A0A212TL41_9BACT|nr:TonB-dependent receptor [Hymenobacter gelipurpurascens]SNC66769.1 iron complex outermembrane recepter protein [Hymenobacter gelipurpurascens]
MLTTRPFEKLMKYLLLVLPGLASVAAHAQTIPTDSTRALPGVLITYQAKKLTPVTFQNLKGSFLKALSVGQEPSFLLTELTPGVTAYSDAGSTQGYAYFRLRGIDQTRINTTLDGVPLNEPEDQGAYFSNYPDLFNSLSSVQIQRGVGTTQNGVASYGGSIQLFSSSLLDSARTTLGGGYGSFGSYRVYGECASGLQGRAALYVRASQLHSDGYKDHSANTSRSVYLSSGLFYDKTSWKLSVLAGQQRNQLAWLGVPDSVLRQNRRANANGRENDNFQQALVQLQNQWQPTPTAEVTTSVYATGLQGGYDFDLNTFLGLPATTELYRYNFRSGGLGGFSSYTRRSRRFTWTSGLHVSTYQRHHIGSEQTAGELYRNTGYKREGSLFSKLESRLGQFTAFADLQGRATTFRYAGSVALQPLTWRFLNPKAGLSFAATDRTTLYYSLGRTGREPTRNDLFGGNDDLLADTDGQALVSNTRAEYVTDHEVGVRRQMPGLQLELNAYYMAFQNEIVLNGNLGPNGLALTDNVARSYRSGLEAVLNWQPTRQLAFRTNAALNRSRIREQAESFQPILTPGLLFNQEAVFQRGRWLVGATGHYQSRSYLNFANSAAISGYALLNARVQYTWRGWQLTVFGNNLTNTRYFNNGYVEADGTQKYFVPAPANFYVNVKFQL